MTINVCCIYFPLQVSALPCLNEINRKTTHEKQPPSHARVALVWRPYEPTVGGCPKKHIAAWMSSKKTGSHGLEHDWWWEYSLHISDVIKFNLERDFNYHIKGWIGFVVSWTSWQTSPKALNIDHVLHFPMYCPMFFFQHRFHSVPIMFPCSHDFPSFSPCFFSCCSRFIPRLSHVFGFSQLFT